MRPSFESEILYAALLLLFLYFWFRYKLTYWSKKGVNGPKPTIPFGNLKDVMKRKKHFFQPYYDNYFKYKNQPYIGMYSFFVPIMSIHDMDLIKQVLIKDFDHFQSHGILVGSDPLGQNLFNVHGDKWKFQRHKLSPAFSLAKLKSMYPTVHEVADEAIIYAERHLSEEEAINFTELSKSFTMEVIRRVGFGIIRNGFTNQNSEFHAQSRDYFEQISIYWTIVRTLAFFFPNFIDMLRINRLHPNTTKYYTDIVKETFDYRQQTDFKGNDYFQIVIDLYKNNNSSQEPASEFTMDNLASNTLMYMVAGYETSSLTGQMAAYELALNPHIQDKVRHEITQVLAKYNGEYTYEAQHEMTYMNMVLDETMRKYPPMRALFRRCTKDYKIPNSNVVIEEGTMIFIPIAAIHMDPNIFPNPDEFNPERFSPQRKGTMNPCHWMPFGEGPRKCVGLRQGYIQSKLVLVKLLQKYEISLDKQTPVPLKLKPSSYAHTFEGNIWLRLNKLN